MNRTITVLTQASGSNRVISSTAITLGDLKEELIANGITFNSSDEFKEGKTKSIFTDDAAILPTQITYRGVTNDDLVIMITPSKRKIESGYNIEDLRDSIEGPLCDLQDSLDSLSDAFGLLLDKLEAMDNKLPKGAQDWSAEDFNF